MKRALGLQLFGRADGGESREIAGRRRLRREWLGTLAAGFEWVGGTCQRDVVGPGGGRKYKSPIVLGLLSRGRDRLESAKGCVCVGGALDRGPLVWVRRGQRAAGRLTQPYPPQACGFGLPVWREVPGQRTRVTFALSSLRAPAAVGRSALVLCREVIAYM